MHNVKDYFVNLDAQRGLRIRQERDKRDWSQQQAADAVGIRREMWAKYEAGAEPGAKALTGMAVVNVDVLYILTGQRGIQSTNSPALRDGEAELLDGYRALSAREKLGVKALIAGMAPVGVSVRVSGNGSHVVTGSGDVVIGHPAPMPVQRRVKAAEK